MGGLREKEVLRIVRHTRRTSVGFSKQELQKEAFKCGCELLREEKTIHLSGNHVHHFNDSQKVARKLHPLPFSPSLMSAKALWRCLDRIIIRYGEARSCWVCRGVTRGPLPIVGYW